MKEAGLPLRVLIADDSTVIRDRLAGLLREVPGVAIVGESEDVLGTINAIRRLKPAVVILDLSMPGGSGLDVLRQMARERLEATVIVFTNYALPEYEKEAREQGASAFLNKSTEFMRVAQLVREYAGRDASLACLGGEQLA
jgi:DNA-binding NarL/FixJ family response regulator